MSFAGNPELCGGVLPPCPVRTSVVAGRELHLSRGALAGLLGGVALLGTTLVLIWAYLCLCHRCPGNSPDEETGRTLQSSGSARVNTSITISDIMEATHNLSCEMVIGKGGYGTVYKAIMSSGQVLAVKRLALRFPLVNSFTAEVETAALVRHRHIVRMMGYCFDQTQAFIMYDYMPNGSVGDILHSRHSNASLCINLALDWDTRFKIAVGTAKSLAYLHHYCVPPIVHRDVKTNNILLDSSMEPYVTDFGLAKLIDGTDSAALLSGIAGSFGYIAPEHGYSTRVTTKSDVYSFGVVLLELLTGRTPNGPDFRQGTSMVEWVNRNVKDKNHLTKVLDFKLQGSSPTARDEMLRVLRVALLCTSESPTDRPDMKEVGRMLALAKLRRDPNDGTQDPEMVSVREHLEERHSLDGVESTDMMEENTPDIVDASSDVSSATLQDGQLPSSWSRRSSFSSTI